ncbi:hypothetical protein AB0E83_08205, partial [Streptomyces sp. NPDC035033]
RPVPRELVQLPFAEHGRVHVPVPGPPLGVPDPSDTLAGVKPVGEWLGDDLDPWTPPAPHQIKPLGPPPGGAPVADGDW